MTKRKPKGFWNSKENTIAEARLVLEKHGPEAISGPWLKKNDYGGLANAIKRHGGFAWIRKELGLEEGQKPNGFWNSKENTIAEARLVLEKHGPEAINCTWLQNNGYGSLASGITKCGGFAWIRQELGLEQGARPSGFWNSKENTLTEARLVLEKHGPGAINNAWLKKNGYSSLVNAISKHGGYHWIRQELGLEEGQKPNGFWNSKENTIAEARLVLEKHGPEAINKAWLHNNGYGGLASGISKHGGIAWIRQELGLEEGQKPNGFWNSKENTIAEARLVLEKHGPEAINCTWLHNNGYGSLASGITKRGGFAWIRQELGLEEGQKPSGFWNSKENTIAEARLVLEKHGPEAINQAWLVKNGYSSLAFAIAKHGGIAWIREELGLEPDPYSLESKAQHFSADLLQLIEDLGDHIHALPQKSWLAILQHSKALKSIGDQSALAPVKIRLLEGKITPEDIKRPEPTPGKEPKPSKLEEELAALVKAAGEDAVEEDEEPSTEAASPAEPEPLDVQEEPEEQRRRLLNLKPEQLLAAVSAAAKVCPDSQLLDQLCRTQTEQLWSCVFAADAISEAAARQKAQETIDAPAADAWAAKVRSSFLADWRLIEESVEIPGLQLPAGQRLNLMQKREAALLLRDRARLNISGMGAGKTRSAICGAQLSGRRRVLVLCPNNTISSWVKELTACLPTAAISSKSWLPEWQSEDHPRWLINNHEMLSDAGAAGLAAALREFCPDAVVIDELHLCKVRDKETESQRHRNLVALAEWAHINEAMLYGMSGTPLVNELGEVVDLIRLINPELAKGLKTRRAIENCRLIHEALQPISSRFVPAPPAQLRCQEIHVRADHLLDDALDACQRSMTTVDAKIAPAKFDALLDLAKQDGKLLVFSSAVAGVLDEAKAMLADHGIKAVIHSGSDKHDDDGNESVDAFQKDPSVKVLLASTSTLATGFDGLQQICNRIAFLTLPWTAAEYEQAVARLLRQGIAFGHVDVAVLVASLVDPETDEDWSLDQQKLQRLTTKRSMAAAVCDGVIPERDALTCTEEKVRKAHRAWAKRVKQARKQSSAPAAA